MWASLFLAGILSGWWGALALAAAPPANRNSLEETSTRTTSEDHLPSMSIAAVEKPLDYRSPTWNFVTPTIHRRELRTAEQQTLARPTTDHKLPAHDVLPTSWPTTSQQRSKRLHHHHHRQHRERSVSDARLAENDEQRFVEEESNSELASQDSSSVTRIVERSSSVGYRTVSAVSITPEHGSPNGYGSGEETLDDSIREVFVSSSKRGFNDRRRRGRRLEDEANVHPKMEESGLSRLPRHSSTNTPILFATSGTESTMERPRVIRSTKQRPKNRTKADSPREQRRRCRNKGCRGQNWCPSNTVGAR